MTSVKGGKQLFHARIWDKGEEKALERTQGMSPLWNQVVFTGQERKMSTYAEEEPEPFYLDGGRPITLHDLVLRGLLEPGDELVLELPEAEREFRATVSSDAQLILPDTRPFPDPTKAAQEVTGNTSVDGWFAWRRTKDGRDLDRLRRILLEKEADRSVREEDGGHLSLNLRRHGKLREARACADRHAPMKMTVRELLALWGTDRRSHNLIQLIQSDLANHGLTAKPSIRDQGMDDRVKLVHTVEGHYQVSPAVGALPSASTNVMRVRENSSLQGALTAMLLRDYSQLPVMSKGKKPVLRGVVTLKSLARALSRDPGAGLRDAVEPCDPVEFHKELIEVLPEIQEKGYVLVNGEDGSLSGIVTASDVVQRYSEAATPFLLIGVIDTLLRRIVAENFSMEVIRKFCGADEGREGLENANNLTMGDYKAVLESPENWQRLGWPLDRGLFIQQLVTIIKIRNIVMHFNPDPLPGDCIIQLRSMVGVLRAYSDI